MKEKEHNLVLLVDSNALIHRAYHAIPATMSNSKGMQTNAVYGFVSALLHALETIKPTHTVCCFDVKGGTFRHELYRDYKAHRKEMDAELSDQIPLIYDLVKAFNIPVAAKIGYEADDLIGTLAKRFSADAKVMILTGDKDTLQLVSDNITVETFKQGMKDAVHYTPDMLMSQFGISPEEFVVYKALRGDPSDNIPGVAGVGEVTALKLVKEYHSLARLYQALGEDFAKHPLLKGKLRESLLKEKDKAELSFRLATIDTNVPMELGMAQAARKPVNKEELLGVFEDLEFRSFIPRLAKLEGWENQKLNDDFSLRCASPDEFLDKLKKASDKKAVAFSFTYQGTLPCQATITGVAFSGDGQKGIATKWDKDVADEVSRLFSNKDIEKRLFDVKSVIHLTKSTGDLSAGSYIDSMLLGLLLQSLADDLCAVNHGEELGDDHLKKAAEYSCKIYNLVPVQLNEITKTGMDNVWKTIEAPLISIIAGMEDRGVRIDIEMLNLMSEEMDKKLAELQKQIWNLTGQEFNIASPQQLSAVLFEKLSVAPDRVKKRVTGFSTDAETLESLKDVHPAIPYIIQHREVSKLKGTYLDALPKLVDKKTNRLHTTFHQLGAATGRLSSSDPNLQNIPIRTELGNAIRKAFIAEDGYLLLSVDYSQIELRILAHLSHDKTMQENFAKGFDIHTATAAKLNDIPLDKVTKEMRRAAKTINFGLLYGLSAHRLSKQLGVDYRAAQKFIDRYFSTYPQIKIYLAQVVEKSRNDGFYQTIFGRRRLFPEIHSSVWAIRQGAERMAMNFPMQGSQADILKKAMIAVGHEFADQPEVARLLLSVHDELVLEVKIGREKEVAQKIKNIMNGICKLDVPMAVTASSGSNWAEMTEII